MREQASFLCFVYGWVGVISGTRFSPEFLEVGSVALEARMKSGLAHLVGSWALLWECSGLVWYPLVSEQRGLQDVSGFLSPDVQRSALGPEGGRAVVLLCLCAALGDLAARHTALG